MKKFFILPLMSVTLLAFYIRPASAWVSLGPTSISDGQVSGINGGWVDGDISQVMINPVLGIGGSISAYAASVNGGVWSTTNLLASSVNWTPLTDSNSSLSVGAMIFDAADTSYRTIIYGAGDFSNANKSGPLNGIFRSTDAGLSWTNIGVNYFADASISSLYVNGSNYVVGVNKSSGTNSAGLYYSTNGGSSFSLASGIAPGQLPISAGVTAITADPNNSQRLFAGVISNGVYVSTNGGASWSATILPSVPVMTNAGIQINPNTNNDNIRIVAQNYNGSTVLYAGVSTAGAASGFFRSTDGGSNWISMSLPTSLESNVITGLNPGGQAGNNFTLIASPTNSNIIYVGGDRQPSPNPNDPDSSPSATNPTSSGAINWTARLFQGTFDAASTNTAWVQITDNYASNASSGITSPHADSRAFTFLPDGSLIQSDDAGIYLRSTPTSSNGIWTSLNGNLSVTEINRVAYDLNTGTLIIGNQDTGAAMQLATNGTAWKDILQGDGGDVAVDNRSRAANGESIRYMQNYELGGLQRAIYDASNNQVGSSVALAGAVTSMTGGGTNFETNISSYYKTNAAFYPRIVVNSVASGTVPGTSSLAYGGSTNLFTSQDGGDTVRLLNTNGYSSYVVDLSYGGVHNGVTNANALWAVTRTQVVLATNNTAQPAIIVNSISNLPVKSNWPLGSGESFVALAQDPKEYYRLAIAGEYHVWFSAGSSNVPSAADFTDLTGNLFTIGMKNISTLSYLSGSLGDALLVGGSGGLFYSLLGNDLANSTNWYSLSALGGAAIPNAYISELLYIPGTTDTLFASTLGRGVWSLTNASSLVGVPEPSTYALIGLGILMILAGARRRARNSLSNPLKYKDMKHLSRLLLTLVSVCLLASCCYSPRWQIQTVQYSAGSRSGDVKVPVLLDTRSGKSWSLDSDKNGYVWHSFTRTNEPGQLR